MVNAKRVKSGAEMAAKGTQNNKAKKRIFIG
jgi:hypothetical protein